MNNQNSNSCYYRSNATGAINFNNIREIIIKLKMLKCAFPQ